MLYRPEMAINGIKKYDRSKITQFSLSTSNLSIIFKEKQNNPHIKTKTCDNVSYIYMGVILNGGYVK